MTSICRATVVFKDDSVFSDIGDANPKNCTTRIIPHLIRMSSTRAKARCFRDALSIGTCSVEELSDFSEVDNTSRQLKSKKNPMPIAEASSLASNLQIKSIVALSSQNCFSNKELLEIIKKCFNKASLEALTAEEAKQISSGLKNNLTKNKTA